MEPNRSFQTVSRRGILRSSDGDLGFLYLSDPWVCPPTSPAPGRRELIG
jgi:hypothetical protein